MVFDDGSEGPDKPGQVISMAKADQPWAQVLSKENRDGLEALAQAYGLGQEAALNIAVTEFWLQREVDRWVEIDPEITGAVAEIATETEAEGSMPWLPVRIVERLLMVGSLYEISVGDALNLAVSEIYDLKIANLRDAEGDVD